MKSTVDGPNFIKDIFPAELAEITKRRLTLDLGEPKFAAEPSVKNGLIGLALSGGGIRSATFSLGVIQALVEKGKFKFVDYTSTVSGGGYIGSCVSSVLNHPDADDSFFENKHGAEDPPTVKHLRNSSNYLSPGGLFDKLRLPTILLRGILLNLFLLVPSLILAVFLTEILNELWHETGTYTLSPLVIIIPFIVMTYLFAFIRRWFRKRFDWMRRNTFELNLAKLLALTVFVLCLIPVFWIVRFCVDNWWSENIINLFSLNSLQGGLFKALFVIAGLIVFFLIVNRMQRLSRITGRILRYVVGILGPMIIFSVYLLFCIFFIESPYFDQSYADDLNQLAGTGTPEQQKTTSQKRLTNLLKGKGYKLSDDKLRVIIISDKPDADHLNPPGQQWEVVFRSSQVEKSLDVRQKKGYLFIPELSIFEAWRTFEGLSLKNLSDLRLVIQWQFYLAGILIFLFNILVLDVNITSSHGFYRDRLSKAYLFRQNEDGSISSNDAQKMSELNRDDTTAPYHLINTALNLPGSTDPNLRGRNADFFTISKCYCGSEHTGYCLTEKIEYLDNHFNLGTAMAVSAAAAAPNMGAMTMKQFVFIMTMLNIRLGYWTPNPEKITSAGNVAKWRWPNVGPRHLLKEAFGSLNARGSHVNLSDGGHIENLAIYQLLKRHCKLIIAVDGEADPKMAFNGLVTLIRYADIDMGITINIDLADIRTDDRKISKAHWTLGTIQYGPGDDGKEEIGHLLYIKSSLTEDENEYIRAYHSKNPKFPHQTTADQFFDETQFECYRALGEHIALGALDNEKIKELMPSQIG
ncbi:MAG: patatin-like phospholipase family protein [Desulfobacterales bacterium]|nr:MAG: patatin-like phospholipase family protein [Desulfobacterales bacterium]